MCPGIAPASSPDFSPDAGANCPASFFQVALPGRASWSLPEASRAVLACKCVSTLPGCVQSLPEASRAVLACFLPLACWRLSGCAVFVCVPRRFRRALRRPKCESVAVRIADSTYARSFSVCRCHCTPCVVLALFSLSRFDARRLYSAYRFTRSPSKHPGNLLRSSEYIRDSAFESVAEPAKSLSAFR